MKPFSRFYAVSSVLLLIIVLQSPFLSCATVPPSEPESPVATIEPPEEPPQEIQPPAPQEEDSAPSTPWPGKARAAISLTFDDGTLEHYTTVFPILKEYGLRGTFFLIPGKVDQEFWQDGQVKRPLLSWEHAREMVAAGHELGVQGYDHRNMLKAWSRGSNTALVEREFHRAKQLAEKEAGATVDSFAWPYWKVPEEGIAPGLQFYKLLRTGAVQEEKYYQGYGPNPMMPGEPGRLLSFALLSGQDPETWRRVGNWVKELGGWWILCIHGIIPAEGTGGREVGWRPLKEAELREFLDALTGEEDIWIAPVGEVFRHVEAALGEELSSSK